jgi:hypothetical protein
MSQDLEPIGALVSAGLAATEIERGSLRAHAGAEGGALCANCGHTLTGPYCQACGQAAHLHRSLLHLLEELGHNVLHFDAKGWRTLPLLAARPGLLTRRYIDGQRTRYVSPLALFLFTGFLMFFVVSMTFRQVASVPASQAERAAAHAELVAGVDQASSEVARATAALAAAQRSGADVSDAEENLADARREQRIAEAALQVVDTAMSSAVSTAGPQQPGDAPLQLGLEQLSNLKIATGHPRLDATIRRQLRNPELFLYRLENTAYKFLFMLIPISLPFLWLMFIGRRGVAVYDHAVFSLYSLSFMSLLISVCALLGRLSLGSLAATLLLCVPPIHMFLQLRGTYGLGALSALWRTAVLLGVAGTAFLLFLGFIVAISIR